MIVGADRIAANGDTANKIGTYGVAILAGNTAFRSMSRRRARRSIFASRREPIPIEERDPAEVTHGFGTATAPAGVRVYSPAFDVTPARYITGFFTDAGLLEPRSRNRSPSCARDGPRGSEIAVIR